jgi:hypothetical protein
VIKFARPVGVLIAAIAAVIPATAVVAAPAANSNAKLYNSLAPPQGNLPSVGFEATQTSEFGNAITLTRAATVASVQVTMDSWGCQTGGWTTDDCVTTPGAKFSEPVTLNIYNAPSSNPTTQPDTVGSGLPGTLIQSTTVTFNIPYRPSANNAKCTGAELGDWFDKTNRECFPGLMTTINFTGLHVALPKNIVFGIAYNTSDFGYAKYGDSTACYTAGDSGGDQCPYDSLNVAVSLDPDNIQKGSDTYPGYVFWNTSTAANYCDSGAAGNSTFRFDSPSTPACWGAYSPYNTAPWYVPAVQFIAS